MRKLDHHVRAIDTSHGAPVVVLEPAGLAWFLPCLYLRAQHPEVKIVRIKTSKVAVLRRSLKQDAKSDRLDSVTHHGRLDTNVGYVLLTLLVFLIAGRFL